MLYDETEGRGLAMTTTKPAAPQIPGVRNGVIIDAKYLIWVEAQRGERPQGCSFDCTGRMCRNALHCDAKKGRQP